MNAMRSQSQISNLRNSFIGMYGPIALLWSEEDINSVADMLQESVIKHSRWTWEIKVCYSEKKDWDRISKEPKTPCCTFKAISSSVEKLFKKYPDISSIQISAKEDRDLTFEFNNS